MKDRKEKSNKKKNNKDKVSEVKEIKTTSKKSSSKKKNLDFLEETNSFDIIIDEERLKDKESLDFSFIENKKKKKARKEIEIIDVDYKKELEETVTPKKKSNFTDAFSTFLIVLLSLILGFLICFIWAKESGYFSVLETNTISEYYMVDDNYVFFGNSVVAQYELDKYYSGLPVVNGGVLNNNVSSLIEYMEENVYIYNPSKVFLMFDVGNSEVDDFIENIEEIILDIKSRRSYAEVYISSIYPTNIFNNTTTEMDNQTIIKLNSDLEKLCKKYNVDFINIYNKLVDENNNIKNEYISEESSLSDEVYELVTTEIMKKMEK